MSSDEIALDNLPPEVRLQLKSLAKATGRTEENLVVEIVRLVLDQRNNPDSQALQQFVESARKASK